MRKFTIFFFMLIGGGLMAACTEPNTYPVTGEECGPEDPVKTMDARVSDCMPASF